MPEKDPMTYSLLTYAGVVALAGWGGVVNWVQRRKDGRAFSFVELVGEICVSGFSGLLAFWICEHYEVAPLLTAPVVGVAGHLGSRTVFILEKRLLDYLPSPGDRS